MLQGALPLVANSTRAASKVEVVTVQSTGASNQVRGTRCQARLHGFNTRLISALTETFGGSREGRHAGRDGVAKDLFVQFKKRPNDLDSANKSKGPQGPAKTSRSLPEQGCTRMYPSPPIRHTNTSLESGGRLPGVCFN